MRPALRLAVLGAASLLAGSPVAAQTVVAGQADGPNCYPFICLSADGLDRWQQIYDASLFASYSNAFITGLHFYNTLFDSVESFDGNLFTLSLSTTSVGVNGLGTSASGNVGADNTVIWSGIVSAPVGGGLSFSLATPFLYTPGAGNLLLDVQMSGSNVGTFGAGLDADYSCGSTVGRAWGAGDAVSPDCYGALVTGFDVRSASTTTPEPASVVLLASGLIAVGGGAASRRRRRLARA